MAKKIVINRKPIIQYPLNDMRRPMEPNGERATTTDAMRQPVEKSKVSKTNSPKSMRR